MSGIINFINHCYSLYNNINLSDRVRTDGMINLINYIIETLLLNWIYFCVSAGIAMFLASVAETVYSYLQVSFRLVQRWVMPDIIAKIKKVVEKTLTPNPWTTHMQGRSSHICIYACAYMYTWNSGKIHV